MSLVDVRPALVKLLSLNSSVTDIVDTRIFPVVLPQGETRDSIVYTRITELEGMTFQQPSGLVSARIQFDSWSKSTNRANTLANLVKETFGGFEGRVDVDSSNYVNIQLIELVNGRDDYDPAVQMYRMSRDYFVWYEDRNA